MRHLLLAVLLVIAPAYCHADEFLVDIPFGAYNPELNTPAEVWYDPPRLSVHVGDTVTWYNDDRESHTVSSGEGSGRYGWMSDNFGSPSGVFESGLFAPGDSWQHTFGEPGTFSYFCTIHPWMEGAVTVKMHIPDYPHDAAGEELAFPLLRYTPDRDIEVNLSWDPPVIMTHERVQFVYQFYDPTTNSNLAKMGYSFVIIQDGDEIFRDTGLGQIGGDYRNYVFEEPGAVIIRIEGIESSSILAEEQVTVSGSAESREQRSVGFTAAVYENPDRTEHGAYEHKPAQRLETYYELMLAIILVPAAMFVIAMLWLRKKPEVAGKSAPI